MKNKLTQINQFNGGMVKDVEPLMVPNTIMTDCLNGTLITYNGNEFALQNDMGNYSFKNGGLSNGFVPVGMKEHQGVLYIISYNPIDNRVEIGSFPSQQTIFSPITNNKENTIEDLNIEKTYSFYGDIESKAKIMLFGPDNNLYLNPGDKYLLAYESSNSSFKEILKEINANSYWKRLIPYIYTNENKLYDVSGYLEIQAEKTTYNKADYIPISWDIPGWLAVKFGLTVPEQFNVYFDNNKIEVKESNTDTIAIYPNGNLKVQTYWNHSNYTDEDLTNIKNNLVYILHATSNVKNDENYNILEGKNQDIEYNKFQRIIYNTIESSTLFVNSDMHYITPALKVVNGENVSYIIYEQFTQSISKNPIIVNTDEITLGNEVFKYYVDENSLTLMLNWNSFPNTVLKYRLSRYLVDDSQIYYTSDWVSVSDITYNGIVLIDIPFSEIIGDSEIKKDNKGNNVKYAIFNKEDIYKIEFEYDIDVGESETISGKKIKGWEEPKVVYITEIVNYWYNIYSIYFDNITLKEIFTKFNDIAKLILDSDYYKFERIPFLIKGSELIDNYEFNYTGTAEGSYLDEIVLTDEPEVENSEVYDNSHFNLRLVYKQGCKFSLISDEKIYILEKPKNQHGKDGRMWKGIRVDKLDGGTVSDSKGNTYNLTINDTSVSFDLFNLITITNNEEPRTKKVSVKDEFLCDYHPKGEKKITIPIDSNNKTTGIIKYRPEYVEFRKDDTWDDKWSMALWYKNIDTIDIIFDQNKLYYNDNGEKVELIPSSDLNKNWPRQLMDMWNHGTFWYRTGWQPDAKKATVTKSWVDDYGLNIYNYYNNYASGKDKSNLIGKTTGRKMFCICIPYKDENSYGVIVHEGDQQFNGNEDYLLATSKIIYCYLMMLYCVRVCKKSEDKTQYVSTFNYDELLQNSIYTKSINIYGNYTPSYYMEDNLGNPWSNEYGVLDHYYTIYSNSNLQLECTISLDDRLKEFIEDKIAERNNIARQRLEDLDKEPDIKQFDVYLIRDYNESENHVKLGSLVKSLSYVGTQVRIEVPSTFEYYMWGRENDYRSVAREFNTIIYE